MNAATRMAQSERARRATIRQAAPSTDHIGGSTSLGHVPSSGISGIIGSGDAVALRPNLDLTVPKGPSRSARHHPAFRLSESRQSGLLLPAATGFLVHTYFTRIGHVVFRPLAIGAVVAVAAVVLIAALAFGNDDIEPTS